MSSPPPKELVSPASEEAPQPKARRPKYNEGFRTSIADHIRAGLPAYEIAQKLSVSSPTVYRYMKKIKTFGTHLAPSDKAHGHPQMGRPQMGRPQMGRPQMGRPQMGRPRMIHEAAMQAVLEFVNATDELPQLHEVQRFLKEKFEIELSTSTISRALKGSKRDHRKRKVKASNVQQKKLVEAKNQISEMRKLHLAEVMQLKEALQVEQMARRKTEEECRGLVDQIVRLKHAASIQRPRRP